MDFVDLFPFAPDVGYSLLALVNFFGSLIPFVPLPGFLLLATMSVGNQYDLHVLALISAVTATIAKQIIFYVSYGGRKIIKEKTRKRMRPFERLIKRYGAGAAFFAAATPNGEMSQITILQESPRIFSESGLIRIGSNGRN